MKKFIIAFLLLMLSLPSYAAEVTSSNIAVLGTYNTEKFLKPLTITAEADGEILAEHGVTLMLDSAFYVIWDKSIEEVTAEGTAVDNGKVSANITPIYNEEEAAVNIPVLADLEEDEYFTVTGLRLRTYKYERLAANFQIDIDGDFETDFMGKQGVQVTDDLKDYNTVGPFPPTDVNYEIIDGDVELTWVNPYDWDYIRMIIEKYEMEEGSYVLIDDEYGKVHTDKDSVFADGQYNTEVDTKYVLIAEDIAIKKSDPVEVEILVEPVEEPIEEPVEEPVEETELEGLDRLFNYYKIRYEIKCMPSGVPASESSSTCLWARIDLIYAQELLERDDIDTDLSERDLYLMGIRLKYPEQRYQDNCIDADEPASNCSALGKALDRIHYFVDSE